MKEIVIRTLADLGPGFGLYGYCGACGRMERLERKALIRALRTADQEVQWTAR